MDTLFQDLRIALRTLRKNPGYTTIALLTLALGIGANTSVFSMVSAVLIRPLPYPQADRLTALWGTRGTSGQLLVAAADFDDWRSQNRTFDDIAIDRMQSVNLTGTDQPSRLVGAFVSANFFPLLGARTALGRLFTPAEDARGSGQLLAVLSYGAWRTRFGADSGIIGRTLMLQGSPYVVIGVAARDFLDPWRSTDVWLPMSTAPDSWFQRGIANVWGVGRMKPGVSADAARRDLSAIAAGIAVRFPSSNSGVEPLVIPLRESVMGKTGDTLLVLLAFVGVLLLIACANVANLQLARAAARQRELSLRAALGAGRTRLVRQLLTESLLLAALGGGAGLFLAVWCTQALVTAAPGGLPVFQAVGVDSGVLLFCAVLSLFTGIVFGTIPAIQATRVNLAGSINERHAGGGPGRRVQVRSALVAVQLALCVVLLVGAGLLLRSLAALQHVELGFNPRNVLTAEFRLPAVKYKTPEQILQFMDATIARVRAIPGVRSAALVRSVPLSGNFGTVTYEVDGHPAAGALQPTA
ncbi:MAG TPA: ABC transporter permease, partial [Gemmatimonadales bacterium]